SAFLDLQCDVQSRVAFGQEIAPPRREHVGPGFYGIEVATNSGRGEACIPAIVVVNAHRDAQPSVGSFEPPEQLRRNNSVPLPEDISPNLDRLIDDSLDGKAAGI